MTDPTGSARFRAALANDDGQLSEADEVLCDQLDNMLKLTTEGHQSSRLHASQAAATLALLLDKRVADRRAGPLDFLKGL